MINNKVKKLKIGDKEYTFKMTNMTVLKIDEMSGNYGTVTNGLINSENLYKNSAITVACSCIEKDWKLEEFINSLTVEQINGQLVNMALELYFDYLGLNLDGLEEDKKNQKK